MQDSMQNSWLFPLMEEFFKMKQKGGVQKVALFKSSESALQNLQSIFEKIKETVKS